MDSITRIRVAYALRKQGIAVKEIAWGWNGIERRCIGG